MWVRLFVSPETCAVSPGFVWPCPTTANIGSPVWGRGGGTEKDVREKSEKSNVTLSCTALVGVVLNIRRETSMSKELKYFFKKVKKSVL